MRPAGLVAIIAAVACGAAPLAPGQEGVTATAGDGDESSVERPHAARRIVRVFDFEQRNETDIRVPLFWHAAQHNPPQRERPGFPIWNRPALDYTVADEGAGSVRLPVRGGSAGLRLQDGAIPVVPGGDYRVRARVLTRRLEHARALLRARLLDQHRVPIPGSEVRSPLAEPRDAWQTLTVRLRGSFDDAAFLQIDLEVLQPAEFLPPPPGERVVHQQDHDGAAWFDEVSVIQLARTELSADAPMSVFMAPDAPAIDVLVRDMTGHPLTARMSVRDLDGAAVHTEAITIPRGTLTETWRPELERFGWYDATLEVIDNQGMRVGRARLQFAWLPASSTRREQMELAKDSKAGWIELLAGAGAGLGLSLERVDGSILDASRALLEAGLGETLVVPLWSEHAELDTRSDLLARLREVINAVGLRGGRVILSFDAIPETVALHTDTPPDRVVSLLGSEPSLWAERIAPLLERFGQSVDHWRFGRPPRLAPSARQPAPSEVESLLDRLARLVPGPRLIVPTLFGHEPRRYAGTRRSIALPQRVGVEEIRDLAALLRSDDLPGPTLATIHPLDAEVSSARGAVSRLVRTVVAVRLAFATESTESKPGVELILHEPWHWLGGHAGSPSARPELAAWRTLADVLGPRRIIQELDAGPDAKAYLLGSGENNETGAIVAWSEAIGADRTLDLLLAEGSVTRVDVFGNRSPIEPVRLGPHDRRAHMVTLGATPIFVEEVDVPLVLYQHRARLEPALIAATGRTIDAELVVENPWKDPLSADRFILEPAEYPIGVVRQRSRASWEIEPRAGPFTVPANEVKRLQLAVSMSPAVQAGAHRFRILTQVDSSRRYGAVFLSPTIEIGSPSIRADIVPMRAIGAEPGVPGAGDLVLEVIVANASEETIGVEIDAYAGDAERSSSIGTIPPGTQARRRMLLPDVIDGGAKEVYVSLRDTATGARINRVVPIP